MVIVGGNFPKKNRCKLFELVSSFMTPDTTTPSTQSSALKRQVLGGQVQLALHTGNRVADPRLGFGPKW